LSNLHNVVLVHPDAQAWLSRRTAGGDTACLGLLKAVEQHPGAARILPLLDGAPLNWSGVYDVLEGLGGLNKLVSKGYDTTKRLGMIWSRAGQGRHPGKPAQSRREQNKPKHLRDPKPPTLLEARTVVLSILQRWLAQELPAAPRSQEVGPPEVTDGHRLMAQQRTWK
jgi:hypothetical protein